MCVKNEILSEQAEIAERNKNGPLSSPAALWIASVSWWKKTTYSFDMSPDEDI